MPKPQFPMHDYHKYKSFRQIGQAILASATASCAFYYFNNMRRKATYIDFYSKYDPIASFNRMRDGGYLDSCPAPKKN